MSLWQPLGEANASNVMAAAHTKAAMCGFQVARSTSLLSLLANKNLRIGGTYGGTYGGT